MSLRIKICGITNAADAQAAAACGADALGFNFFSRSPRFIPEERAADIVRALPPFIEPVAVFVQEALAGMNETFQRLRPIRTIQYHGPNLSPPPPFPLCFVPAFGIKDEASLRTITGFLDACRAGGTMPAAILVDALVPGLHGGTGQVAPWQLLASFHPGVPVILAGGLTADNVADAIRIVRPYGVDVASGVEQTPGRKEVAKMRRFIDQARNAAVKWL